jgi:tetratricopeptide (TPR) repeat protein
MGEERPAAGEHREHPAREELHGFLLGRLDRAAARTVLDHLATDCPACREVLAPVAEVMFRPWREPGLPSPFDEGRYDFPLARFAAAVRREMHRRGVRATRRPAPAHELLAQLLPPRQPGREAAWRQCEALLAESWAMRHEDPGAMLVLAIQAVAVAEEIDPALRGPQALADLQTRAWAALGNARRVTNDVLTPEFDFEKARERFRRGTGDVLLLARLMDLSASLFMDRRQFAEAQKLLAWAFQVYEREGETHLAGKTLLQRALAAGYDAEPDEAVELLTAAFHRLDPARDPEALLACLHALAMAKIDCGHFEEAEDVLWSARELYQACGGRVNDLKLLALEGRIAAGLGRLAKAERNFEQARRGFLALDLPYTAGIAALDLAVVHLERGQAAAARAVVSETIEIFDILGIHREAFMAVALLAEALRQDRLSVAILKSAAAELQLAER